MDPLSQFAVGGVFAAAFAPPVLRAIRRLTNQPAVTDAPAVGPAILCAGLAAMAPDLDVLVRAADYPLLAIKYHRHFTHALALAPLYALLLMPLFWLVFRKHGLESKLRVFVLLLLGIATHGVLDAMTNYGTHLWWPFTNARTSWNIISIVDPIFTLTLIAAMVAATWRKSTKPLKLAFAFMLLYWGAGLHQRHAAEAAMLDLAASRNHTVVRHQVKPSFANIIVWRAQYEADGKIHTDAINVLPFVAPKVYEGSSNQLLVLDDVWLKRLPAAEQQDIRDFAFFSDGWVSAASGPNGDIEMIGDMRFAALPNASGPMWALRLNTPTAKGHAVFTSLPRTQNGDWAKLWGMVVRR